ncbi:unnamed protein product [Pleuronectes platessa]|uniref:Uncharacterized protein n=1 Tax=Pleuronectes platessa TaxID=8262 RepID=A0A9N7YUE0_PLEPL|nr:unnamed protein product [Pleuronectes platessa]
MAVSYAGDLDKVCTASHAMSIGIGSRTSRQASKDKRWVTAAVAEEAEVDEREEQEDEEKREGKGSCFFGRGRRGGGGKHEEKGIAEEAEDYGKIDGAERAVHLHPRCMRQ